MQTVFLGLSGVFSIVALACHIVVLFHAFRASVAQGFLCLCIPCYTLYYMFARFEHPQKTLVITGWLGGNLASQALLRLAQSQGRAYRGYDNM